MSRPDVVVASVVIYCCVTIPILVTDTVYVFAILASGVTYFLGSFVHDLWYCCSGAVPATAVSLLLSPFC